MGVGGQCHATATLPPGKTWYPFYRRLCEPQGCSGKVRKISPPPGFDPRNIQAVARRYTNQWHTGGVCVCVFKHPPRPEILKALQNHAKLNLIVKTVKNC